MQKLDAEKTFLVQSVKAVHFYIIFKKWNYILTYERTGRVVRDLYRV